MDGAGEPEAPSAATVKPDPIQTDEARASGGSPVRSKRAKLTHEVAVEADEVVLDPMDCANLVPVVECKETPSAVVTLSLTDKAQSLMVHDDKHTVTGWKGYRSIRATHGVASGTWYCEVYVRALGETGHCRLGWCTNKHDTAKAVGVDAFGFSYRDIDGSKVHLARREPYGAPYTTGDTVGMLIHLPAIEPDLEITDGCTVRYKGAVYELQSNRHDFANCGSFVGFCKNGEWQGVAFEEVPQGQYFPAASLFNLPSETQGASVTFNFGPNFAHPVPTLEKCPAIRPMSEAVVVKQEALAAEIKHEEQQPVQDIQMDRTAL